jgi:YVTN family beta-propeller protein
MAEWSAKMFPRLNYRLIAALILIAASAATEILLERRPSILRPGLRLDAFVANTGDGTVSVVDLVRLVQIATIPVGPSPSGLRAHPTLNQVWGVSTDGGYVFAIDSATGKGTRVCGVVPLAGGTNGE